jgi:hypothetical protein
MTYWIIVAHARTRVHHTQEHGSIFYSKLLVNRVGLCRNIALELCLGGTDFAASDKACFRLFFSVGCGEYEDVHTFNQKATISYNAYIFDLHHHFPISIDQNFSLQLKRHP